MIGKQRKPLTKLQHSDEILRAVAGETLLVVEPVEGVDMAAGGAIKYGVGDRLRFKFKSGDLLWALDDEARSASFSRREMFALERQGAKK